MKIKLLLWGLALLMWGHVVLAGTTGKIHGRITEKDTGEPLLGVNVVVEGTRLGAATDATGYYVILNIPPGTYALMVTMIGYQPVRMTNVKVVSDLTTTVNVQMTSEVIEVGKVIEVIAERPLVITDLTSSQATVSAEEIRALPIEVFEEVLETKAGVIEGAGGEIHIRGGRSNEVAYLVNGVSVANPFNNDLGVDVAANAIEEMTLVSGTFNAEYGNAMSGVVNLVTKEGGKKFSGQIVAYTGDNLSTNDELFFNIDELKPLNNYVLEGTFGGPILGETLTFFTSARYNNDRGWLYGIREHRPSDYADFTLHPPGTTFAQREDGDTIRVTPGRWYVETTGDGEIVPLNPLEELYTTFKLTFRPSPSLKITSDALFDKGDRDKAFFFGGNNAHNFKYNPDGVPQSHSTGLTLGQSLTHSLSGKTFYQLRGAFTRTRFEQYLYRNPTDPRYVPDFFLKRPGSNSFYTGGNYLGHVYEESRTFLGKVDLTSQVSARHQLKTGLEAQVHRLFQEVFTVQYSTPQSRYPKPTIPDVKEPTHDRYVRWPVQFSAYLQDKMEYPHMIINAGLRYDFFHAQAFYPEAFNVTMAELRKARFPEELLDPEKSQKAKAKPKHSLSPRLGISFPITDRGIIHLAYGHFVQMPSFRFLYTNPEFESNPAGGTNFGTFGNANLKPERTIAYEIGLQQQILENVAVDVTGFYKDVRDLLALETTRVASNREYSRYVNKDYGNIRGITLSVTKRRSPSDWISATLDYTYQVAEGNYTGTDAFFFDIIRGRESERLIVPLNWDQTHTLNGTITVSKPNDWGFSVIGQAGSGLPYSPSLQGIAVDRPNSARKPTRLNVDFKAYKDFRIGGLTYSLFVKIFNVFDTQNQQFVFDDTGTAKYSLIPTYSGQDVRAQIEKGVPGIHPIEEHLKRPHWYSEPRQVRVGVQIGF